MDLQFILAALNVIVALFSYLPTLFHLQHNLKTMNAISIFYGFVIKKNNNKSSYRAILHHP